MLKLSDKLKAYRKQAGLTQQEVANVLGITKSTYCHYEANNRTPDIEKLHKLIQLFNLSDDQLLNPHLPIIQTTYYPNELLNHLESTIRDNRIPSNDYKENRIKLETLATALQPVMDIRDRALSAPELDIEDLPVLSGTTIKRVNLDARAEKLIGECMKCQNRIIQNYYGTE